MSTLPKITTFPIEKYEISITEIPGNTGFASQFTGNIYTSRGRFGNGANCWDISATEMKTANFVSGLSGVRITYAGVFEAETGYFRGDITGASGTFSGTLSAVSGTFASLYTNAANAITIDYGGNILLKHGGDIKFTSVTAPIACSAALAGAGAGNVDNGEHYYKVTYVNAAGETELGAVSNSVTVVDKTADGQVSLTSIPVSSSGSVTKRKIYRTEAGGTNYYLLTTINDNTTTIYTDNTADVDLTGGIANYKENDSFGKLFVDGIKSLSLGGQNIFVGQYTGFSNTTGGENLAMGHRALYSNTTGESNSAMGYRALYNTTTGGGNLAIGSYALFSNTTGGENLAMGNAALYNNTTAFNNLAVGVNALFSNTTGNQNLAVGMEALFRNITGNQNLAVGREALFRNTAGNDNVALGFKAGYYETGSNKLFIDNQSRANEADARVKALIYGVFDASIANQKLFFHSNVYIGANAERATTVGSNLLNIFNGTAPAGTLANGCSFYSTAGEMRVMDAAGNATLLSPHDKDGEWIFYSKNTVTGKVLKIKMEKLVRFINKKFGTDFIEEFTESH